jgi:hypothetical protein
MSDLFQPVGQSILGTGLPSMSDEEMREYIEKYDWVLDSVVTACFYRILGQASLHFNLWEIIKLLWAECKIGKYGGELKPIIPNYWYVWKNVKLGKDITQDFYVWGLRNGTNTIFTRPGFWRMALGREYQHSPF